MKLPSPELTRSTSLPDDGGGQGDLRLDPGAGIDQHECALGQEEAVDRDRRQRNQRHQWRAQDNRQQADLGADRPQHPVLGHHHRAVERERIDDGDRDRAGITTAAEHAGGQASREVERPAGEARQALLDHEQAAQEEAGQVEDRQRHRGQPEHAGDQHEPWQAQAQVERQDDQRACAEHEHDEQAREPLDQDAGRHRAATVRCGCEHQADRVAAHAGGQEIAEERADPIELCGRDIGQMDPGALQQQLPFPGGQQDGRHACGQGCGQGAAVRAGEHGERRGPVDGEPQHQRKGRGTGQLSNHQHRSVRSGSGAARRRRRGPVGRDIHHVTRA